MVIYRCDLTEKELIHYINCVVSLERVVYKSYRPKRRKSLCGVKLPINYNYKKGYSFGKYNEIIINGKVLRVKIRRIRHKYNGRYNCELGTPTKLKSILKYNSDIYETPKSVKFNDTVIVTPISPRKINLSSEDEVSSDAEAEINLHKEHFLGELNLSVLESKKINSNYIRQRKPRKMTTEEEVKPVEQDVKKEIMKHEVDTIDDVTMIPIETILNKVEPQQQIQYIKIEEVPKRKRGRPRKVQLDPDPPFSPFSTPKKKPYITPKKPIIDPNEPKRRRGRPRKKIEFGFHNILNDSKAINLPSESWSVHASATSKRSQVCFTRVQTISDSVPVECDKSVKFIGGKNFFIKMNNRLVELVGAPKTVESLKDIEILLEIVNDLNINDPVLRYYVR